MESEPPIPGFPAVAFVHLPIWMSSFAACSSVPVFPGHGSNRYSIFPTGCNNLERPERDTCNWGFNPLTRIWRGGKKPGQDGTLRNRNLLQTRQMGTGGITEWTSGRSGQDWMEPKEQPPTSREQRKRRNRPEWEEKALSGWKMLLPRKRSSSLICRIPLGRSAEAGRHETGK